jgi:hypothetical protein
MTSVCARGGLAVQANPLGFLFGSYAGNFQYQVAPHHGVMGEIGFASRSSDLGGIETSQSRFNIGAHYRYHFNPTMDSWFLGPFAKFVSLNGESTVTTTDLFGNEETESSSYSANTFVLGGNIGRRWIFTQGLSLVARVGYGATSVSLDIEGDGDVLTDDDIEVLERAFGVALGFDFELSIGWAF